jgi:predicted metal-dependent phosphoesterase TrpH
VRIDLHTHSSISDGTETPAELMRAAARAGLDVVGMCDHDTTAGWEEASGEAVALGIELVPGIEVSCKQDGRSVHLLALWPDAGNGEMVAMLTRTRASRIDRAKEIVARLARDYPLEWEAVAARSKSADTVGRPHIADALVDVGLVESREQAFAELLGADSPYYVPHYAPDVIEAVRCVRRAGGVPVLAHPGAIGRGSVLSGEAIGVLVEAGLAGLEIDHRDNSIEQRDRLAAIATRFGLVRTGSSDYHGEGKPNRLGENLTTDDAYAALKAVRG